MPCKDLANRLKQKPFNPFRIIVSEGATYDIRHPEQIMIASDSVTVGIPSQSDEFYETTSLIDLIRVARLEPIPSSATKP